MNWFTRLMTWLGLRHSKGRGLAPPPKHEFGLYEYGGDEVATGFAEDYIKDDGGQLTGIVVSGDKGFVEKVVGFEDDVIVRLFVPAHHGKTDQVTHFQARVKGFKSPTRLGKLMVSIEDPHVSNEPTDVTVEEDDEKGSFM